MSIPTSSFLLLPSNADRIGFVLTSNSRKKIYISFNDPAIIEEGILIESGDIYENNTYTGDVYAVQDGNSSKKVTVFEIT